jgi:hypothetical protein
MLRFDRPAIFAAGPVLIPRSAHERGARALRLFLRSFRCFQHRLGNFFREEPFQHLPLDRIDRGIQQVLKPFDVGVCRVGQVGHRRPPPSGVSGQAAAGQRLPTAMGCAVCAGSVCGSGRAQFCAKLLIAACSGWQGDPPRRRLASNIAQRISCLGRFRLSYFFAVSSFIGTYPEHFRYYQTR